MADALDARSIGRSRHAATCRESGVMREQLKPWQIVLFVVAVLACVASVAWSVMGGDQPKMARSVLLVDVTTGELFRASTKQTLVLPERNPDSGKSTLLPVSKNPEGKHVIDRRYIDSLDPDVKPIILKDGVANVKAGEPRTLDRK
ncbi:MAG: hypothetical protein SFZ23_10280 [Planctomycetota bacterium]|nr:hypothetical protein [Planctomycetota bacterium]